MIKFYNDSTGQFVISEGLNLEVYHKEDLLASVVDGDINITRPNEGGSELAINRPFAMFEDKDGNSMGATAQEVVDALNVVFSGQPLENMSGADGQDGEQGIQGIQGEKGDKGDRGDKGDTGDAGADGQDGQDGSSNIIFSLGSRFLLDPNEFAGWSVDGIYDQTHTSDLGNVGATATRTAGGLSFPFDVRVKRIFAWHYNSNALALGWGWRLAYQTKTGGSNSVTTTDILRECVGVGAVAVPPRNYLNTTNQNTDIDLSGSIVIPAGSVIIFGVEAPTAIATNYYVFVQSGYLEIERV